jgi:hypothetical protein
MQDIAWSPSDEEIAQPQCWGGPRPHAGAADFLAEIETAPLQLRGKKQQKAASWPYFYISFFFLRGSAVPWRFPIGILCTEAETPLSTAGQPI